MSDKRKDYISWDEYFMGVAKLSALRSKDPNTQVGACIVSSDNKILSMGYNGLPRAVQMMSFHGAGKVTPWIINISTQLIVNLMPYLITVEVRLMGQRCMSHCSLAMNVPRLLFRQE